MNTSRDDESSIEVEEDEESDDKEDEIGAEETVPSSSAPPEKRQRIGRVAGGSVIWQYFSKGLQDAKCNVCKHVVKKNDTGNCKKHLQKNHPKEYRSFVTDHEDNQAASAKTSSSKNKQNKQLTIKQSLSRSVSYSANDERQQQITAAWARAFAGNSLAYNLIESTLFREALKIMDRRYVPPARDGMKRQVAEQAELLRRKMRESIDETSKLSLCVDLWTKRSLTQSFVGVTAHFVDKRRGRLVRLLLSVKEILGSHTAENIAENVLETLSESDWNIADNKVRCIITDNGSNVVKAFHEWQESVIEQHTEQTERCYELGDQNIEAEADETAEFDKEEAAHFAAFGREKRLPCAAHSLVCALKASIEKAAIYKSILALATSLVTAFTQSTLKSGKLFQLTGKRLIRPVRTRWLYVYYMLRRLLDLRAPIDSLIEADQMDMGLNPKQWRETETLCTFLKDFAEQVAELEGEKYVTLNRVIPALMDLLEHCKEFEQKPGFKQIAVSVAAELRCRFNFILSPTDSEFQPIFAVTTFLDPSIRSLLSLQEYSPLLSSAKAETLRLMRSSDLYLQSDANQASVSSDPVSASSLSSSKYKRVFSKLAEQGEQQSTRSSHKSSVETELSSCLQLQKTDIGDPIEFWLSQQNSMPHLFTLAMDLFSATATSAPIERVFSHAGIATYGRRNRIEGDSLNAELLMKMNHFLLE